jgi:hypothetical protein
MLSFVTDSASPEAPAFKQETSARFGGRDGAPLFLMIFVFCIADHPDANLGVFLVAAFRHVEHDSNRLKH